MFTRFWNQFLLSLQLALSLFSLADAKILQSFSGLQARYDFVIVGGGTAGCVLANRLSENPKNKVLLIEAGGSNVGVQNAIIPFLGVALPGTAVDWNFTTTPQAGLGGRVTPLPRGHVLGGSSTINLMTWNRGSDDVWDRWARITQDPGWSSKSIQPFYLKTNRLVPSADGHNTTGQFVPSAYGNGPVEVSLPGFPTELDDKVLNTSKELGGRFPFTVDLNAGKAVGFSFLQSSIGEAKRSSSATAYLEPVLNRTNLDVLINTRATKVRSSGNVAGKPFINVVEIATGPTSPRHLITADKELILSAGVFGTAQLLLLSGIGPKSALVKQGIVPLLDLPSVGQNLTDHFLFANYFSVNSNRTFDGILRDPALFGADIQEYLEEGQGLMVDAPGNTLGFVRLPSNSPIFKKVEDPSAGPGSGHTEMIFVDGFAALGTLAQPATGNFLTLLTAVVSPTSRGNLTLATSDPFDKPLIDPAYFSTEFDVFAVVQAMKDAQTFISARPWAGFIGAPLGDLGAATTDEAKAALVKAQGITFDHSVGTAAMSPVNAKWGVVNPDLTLKGARGLRIVDASIFPAIPEAHLEALVYTVAERAAHLIQTSSL